MESKELIKPEDYDIDLTEWNALSIKAERIAEAITVDSDEEEQMGINSLADIKRFMKQVEEARKGQVDPFNKLVKRVNDIFRPINDGLEKSELVIKDKIKTWRIKKEQIRKAEEDKRQREYQAKIAEEQAKAKKEKREAEIILPPPTIIQTQTKGSSATASDRKTWKAEITDLKLFIKAISDGVIPIEAIEVKQSFLNTQARAFKRDGVYPGVKFFEDTDISIRT
jgi:hypothetical protein